MLNDKEEIIANAFGLWLSALFSDIAGYNPQMDFSEQKRQFFDLVQELLVEGRIKFCTPNEFWCEGNDIWSLDPKGIVEYLRAKWPEDAESENDLSDYFFEIPAVLWVDEKGKLVGS